MPELSNDLGMIFVRKINNLIKLIPEYYLNNNQDQNQNQINFQLGLGNQIPVVVNNQNPEVPEVQEVP
jgi:hypothetical protein